MAKKDDEKNPKNLFKRGDSWVLDFIYRGQRYTEVLGPVSRTVAKETRNKRIGDAAAGRLEIGSKIEDLLFEKAMEEYLVWYKANRAAYTYQQYALTASKPLKRSFDGKRLSQITPFAIEAHRIGRKRGPAPEHPNRKAVSDTTVNHELTLLKHLLNKCVTWKFLKSSPFAILDENGLPVIQLAKLNDERTRHLSAEEAERLLGACDQHLRLLVLTAMMTGFRRKEITSLKWQAVDLVSLSITIESAYSKNGDARTVPLVPELAAGLQKLRDERKPKPEDPVFTHEGQPWKSWRKSFNTALKHAGIVDFRWHDLRHCFGSWLAMADIPDKARMELMGHKTPEMTMRYTHLSDGYKRQAVAKLPQFSKEMLESESQQISQQADGKVVVAFSR